MAKKITSDSGYNLSPSYDLGINFTFRDILKGNPIRERFFHQWIAKFDQENIRDFYDYDTGKALARSPQAPTEVYYDQIQRMVYSANLPQEIENELFYHLDYHVNKDAATIDFLKVKEFFAFCGIEGVYDIDNKRHFLMEYSAPYVVDNLHFETWSQDRKEEFREHMARMMAAPGEVPDNRKTIEELRFKHNLLWKDRFMESEVSERFFELVDKVCGSEGMSPEETQRTIEQAKLNNITLDDNDHELKAFNDEFESSFESQTILQKIEMLKQDEREKLAIAKEKYVSHEFLSDPSAFHACDENMGSRGMTWDREMNHHMRDDAHWAKVYIGHDSFKSCSNDEPTEDELKKMRPNLVSKKLYNKARFAMLRDDFLANQWPLIPERFCAIQDWILRDYFMSDINRGELARMRREDIPILFAEAVRDEMNDGLLKKLNFPVRIEPLNDGTGNYYLVLNNEKVEIFHPDEVLPILDSIKQAAVQQKPDEDIIDFKLHAPALTSDQQIAQAKHMVESSRDDEPTEDEARRARAHRARREYNEHTGQITPPLGRDVAEMDIDGPEHRRRNRPRNPLNDFNRRLKKGKKPGELPIQKKPRRGGGGGGMPSIGFSWQGGDTIYNGGNDALEATKQAREGLDGKPGSWNDYKKSLDNLGDEVSNIAQNPDKPGASERLKGIGREMKKAAGLFRDSIMNNKAISEIANQCKEVMESITKMVSELLKMLQNLFGGASPSPSTP